LAQQALDCFGDERRGAAIADGARDSGVLAYGSAEAEVVGVGELAFVLDLLAFDADVGNPVLAAAVGAAGYVELELLVESGQALFKFVDDPAGEAFGLSDGQLAELGAGAGDGAAPEGRAFDVETDLPSSRISSAVLLLGMSMKSRFCETVVRKDRCRIDRPDRLRLPTDLR
jgi:hypothetical protein